MKKNTNPSRRTVLRASAVALGLGGTVAAVEYTDPDYDEDTAAADTGSGSDDTDSGSSSGSGSDGGSGSGADKHTDDKNEPFDVESMERYNRVLGGEHDLAGTAKYLDGPESSGDDEIRFPMTSGTRVPGMLNGYYTEILNLNITNLSDTTYDILVSGTLYESSGFFGDKEIGIVSSNALFNVPPTTMDESPRAAELIIYQDSQEFRDASTHDVVEYKDVEGWSVEWAARESR